MVFPYKGRWNLVCDEMRVVKRAVVVLCAVSNTRDRAFRSVKTNRAPAPTTLVQIDNFTLVVDRTSPVGMAMTLSLVPHYVRVNRIYLQVLYLILGLLFNPRILCFNNFSVFMTFFYVMKITDCS